MPGSRREVFRLRSLSAKFAIATGTGISNLPPMGRQWLHAKRAIVNLKKGQAVQKLVKEITVAAKLGGGDLGANARLFAAVEKAKKASVTRDVIQRAINKGAGIGGDRPPRSSMWSMRATRRTRCR
jgi:hypothetical protein